MADGTIAQLTIAADSMDSGAPLSKAISAIERSAAHGVIVMNGREFTGVIDDRCLRDYNEDPTNTKLAGVAVRTPVASPATTPEELVQMFLETHSRIIPVMDGSAVKGVITRPSVMRLVEDAPLLKGRKAGELASREAIIPDSATIFDCRNKMQEMGLYHLAVVDAAGKLAGVVSSYDVCVKVLPHLGEKASHHPASATNPVMAQSVKAIYKDAPASIGAEEPLAKAAHMMYSANVSALVIVDASNKPIGLLSVRDALHAVLKDTAEPVLVYGLSDEDKPFEESIRSMAAEAFSKLARKMPSDHLSVHVKSVKEGAKRRYNVKAKIMIGGRYYSISTREVANHKASWDLRLSVKEALDELSRNVSDKERDKPHSKERRGKSEE